MENSSLGQKIKKYRERAGLSQFKLELEIGLASGSISRFENNQVKPTKETLSKISNALKLKSREIADLLGLEIYTPEELISAINKISKCLDLETTLQTAVDIMFGLYPNYNGGIILLLDSLNKKRLVSRTVSNMPKIHLVHKLLPKRISEYYINVDVNSNNMCVKTIVNKQYYQSFELFDFGVDVVPKAITDAITAILGFKVGITIPMIFEHEIMGVAFYTKNVRECVLEEEIRVLILLTEQLSISINKAKLFEEINNDIDTLKSKIGKFMDGI